MPPRPPILESKEEVITFCNNLQNSGGGSSSATVMLEEGEEFTDVTFEITYIPSSDHFTVAEVHAPNEPIVVCNTTQDVWRSIKNRIYYYSRRRRGLGKRKRTRKHRKGKGKKKSKSKRKK